MATAMTMATPDTAKDVVPLRAWGVLAILICFYLLSFLDKQMYALLITQIGASLNLQDFDLGVIQGVGFSGFYTAGVILVGWMVDRYSRRMILLVGVLFWSLCAAASGLTDSYWGLFTARAGVGLGEAVMMPAALAIIAITFPRNRLSFATGIFFSGANLGGVVALLAGGSLIGQLVSMGETTWPVVGTLAPWQAAFMLTGIPGALIAFLAFALPSGKGRKLDAGEVEEAVALDAVSVLDYVRTHKAFLAGVMLCTGFLTMLAYTLIVWTAAYFERQFGWGHAEIGVIMAFGIAFGGLGNILWGWTADWLRRKGYDDGLYRLFIALTLIGFPIAYFTFTTENPTVAMVCYPLVWLFANSFGPLLSAVPMAVPDHLRGRIIGAKTFFTGLIGLSIAPMFVGALTDFVFGDKAMLGYSMIVSILIAGSLAIVAMLFTRKAFVSALREQDAVHAAKVAA